MASKYIKADAVTQTLFDEVVAEHHKELDAIGITFDVLLGFAAKNDDGEVTGPALKIHGFPTNSISAIVNLKNRVKGNADAEIILDGDTLPNLNDEQIRAVIDRAIQFFEVARNIDGAVVLDTHGRPKLKMRAADWNFQLFNCIAERHGVASPEVETLKRFSKQCSTLYFTFMEETKGSKPALKAPKAAAEKKS